MEDLVVQIEALRKNADKIFIYGIGVYGRNLYHILCRRQINVDGFVQTSVPEKRELFGLPVYSFADVMALGQNIAFIVGTNRYNYGEIAAYLDSGGFDMEKVINGGEYIDNGGVRGGYDENPSIDLTTKIGCSVNCRFCPQALLLKNYYRDNPERDTQMSMETFDICLSRLPQNCEVSFAGMVEPFLNPLCIDMMEKACKTGRSVNLYTTLVGASKKDIERMLELPLQFVTLHVADKCGYAHIPLTEEYYQTLERLVSHKKDNGTSFVNICNAQAEPDARVKQICSGKLEILSTLHDRAGNLEDDNLVSKRKQYGMLKCGVTGNILNNNVLLPDGTVLLCFMDYGMKHILGNLKESSYEEIMNGIPMQRIKEELNVNDSDILCRNCSCANGL